MLSDLAAEVNTLASVTQCDTTCDTALIQNASFVCDVLARRQK